MTRKDYIFILTVCGIIIAIMIVPIRSLVALIVPVEIAGSASTFIKGSTVSVFSFLAARKMGLLDQGGFVKGRWRNYWMFLLPLFYPGLILSGNFRVGCLPQIELLTAFVHAVFFGLMEEISMRGLLQGYLLKHHPGWSNNRICMLSAGCFSLLHLVNLRVNPVPDVMQQLVYAFIIGLLMGAIVIRTRNVWLAGIVHGILNFLSGTCPSTSVSEPMEFVNYFVAYAYAIGMILVIFSPVLVMYWLLLKTIPKSKQE